MRTNSAISEGSGYRSTPSGTPPKLESHKGLERIVRSRKTLKTSAEAKAWEKKQDWHTRVADRAADARYWAWWVE